MINVVKQLVRVSHYKLLFLNENGVLKLDNIATKLGVSLNTVKKYVRMLGKEGLVEKIDENTFRLTNLGSLFVKSVRNILERKSVPSYVVTDPVKGEPLQLKLSSYKQLYAILEFNLAPQEIINEHIRRGFLQNWVKDGVGDEYLYELMRSNVVNDSTKLLNYLREVIKVTEELVVEG